MYQLENLTQIREIQIQAITHHKTTGVILGQSVYPISLDSYEDRKGGTLPGSCLGGLDPITQSQPHPPHRRTTYTTLLGRWKTLKSTK